MSIRPLVFQEGFNTQTMSTILASTIVQDTIIDSLITEAKNKGYIGWQFDFEHMIATDRDAYGSFVERTAKKFNEQKLMLSVAVIGRTSENPKDLPERSWDYWAGVFDYKRIGKAADFVTLMGTTNLHQKVPWRVCPG